MYIAIHVMRPRVCDIFTELKFSQYIFGKHSNIKFHENPFIGSRFVPFGRTDGQAHRHGEGNSLFFDVLGTGLNTYDTNRIVTHYLIYKVRPKSFKTTVIKH
jgi:hypothetical protein